MPDLEITVEYDKGLRDIRPEKILQAATRALKLLRAVESEVTGKKRPTTLWRTHVIMLSGRAVITFDAMGNQPAKREVIEKMAKQPPSEVDTSRP